MLEKSCRIPLLLVCLWGCTDGSLGDVSSPSDRMDVPPAMAEPSIARGTIAQGATAAVERKAMPQSASGVDSRWQATVERRIADSGYAIRREGDGFRANGARQGFSAAFDARGVQVSLPAQPSAAVRIGGSAVGRSEQRTSLHAAALQLGSCRADGAVDVNGACLQRLEGRRGPVTELWENRRDGLEHSFIVHERPAGAGELSVEVSVENAEVSVDPSGTSARLVSSAAGLVFNYAGLKVWDANRIVLASRMERTPGGLELLVDDAGAAYPVTIDPVLSVPDWTTKGEQETDEYGYSVASAGDVNGDGFDDVIVGAPNAGDFGNGRAYVYRGGAAGLSTTAAWAAEGVNDAVFGVSVAGAGDVNGDGFDDVIVGADHFTNGQGGEGRAFVYHGSPAGLPAAAAWTAESNQITAFFGRCVAGAGDVNGDGFDDVIVGAWSFDNGQSNEGRSFVYHGSASGLGASAAWTAEGNQVDAAFGITVAGAGDVNGDGFADVIVGAPDFENGQIGEGRAFVYHGGPSGLSSAAAWVAESNKAGASFGAAVASAGDVNGDGFADVVVGAPNFDNTQVKDGLVLVYHGSVGGLATAAAWSGGVNLDRAGFGHVVASAGDVNNDGFDDIAVGATDFSHVDGVGMAYVYHGGPAGLHSSAAWKAETFRGFESNPFAASLAAAGDVNGDGFGDLVIGSPEYDDGFGRRFGRAFVYHGGAAGLGVANLWSTESNQVNARYGYSVASAGDVNSDGFDDIIVGAPYYELGPPDEGRIYVYHGSATGPRTTPARVIESGQMGALFGYAVAGAGDVNGDGFDDVAVGSPYFDNGQTNEGLVAIFHGSPTGLGASAARTAEGNQASALFGYAVAGAGDVDGDGFDDVLIGAPYFDNGQINEGRVFLHRGTPSGLTTVPAWTQESNQADSGYGLSVAGAGDVNGDGFGDVVVGAYLFDNGQTDEGRAFVYQGSASGLVAAASWTQESNQAGAQFGISVAGAGDVNGDGFGDVVVGARGFDTNLTNAGAAFVYSGRSSGLSTSASRLLGTQAGQQLGYPVASAGDINADGFSDVILGASLHDNGQTDEGAVFLHIGHEFGLHVAPAFTLESNQAGAAFGFAVAGAGDTNGDGLGDLVIGSPLYDAVQTDEGRVIAVY